MEVYTVGGAVRDRLLGLPPGDRDYVVVGSDPAAMLAAGFKPVGKDFPVFLHPETHEEYALARTERKTGHGYHGFSFYAAPDVTLEADLARRDLTINAIAEGAAGQLIDPYGGQQDLAQRILRHVSPAFAEDPVRILRLARFAARFPEFTVAAETQQLLQNMVAAGEVDHLVPERVWQELSRALMTEQPERFFVVLNDCGALNVLFPGISLVVGRLAQAVQHNLSLPVRTALWLAECSADSVTQLAEKFRLPADCRDLARLLVQHRTALLNPQQQSAEDYLVILERCDGIRRPERFQTLLTALPCLGATPEMVARWRAIQAAAVAVDAGAIALRARTPEHIAACIRDARIEAIQNLA